MLGAVRRIVGTSAGALIGFFFAIGMTVEDVTAWLCRGLRGGALTELDLEGIVPFVSMDALGIDGGERFAETFRDALRTSKRFLGRDDVTFRELAEATGCDLVINVANLDIVRTELLCAASTPDLSVIDALRMTTSVPCVFAPVLWNGHVYVDGGVLDNCPLEAAASFLWQEDDDDEDQQPMVFNINHKRARARARDSLPDAQEYMCMVINAVLQQKTTAPASFRGRARIVNIDTSGARLDENASDWTFSLETLSLSLPDSVVLAYIDYGDRLLASRLSGEQRFDDQLA
jgi:predicted acylesterase/phospholipase RssA